MSDKKIFKSKQVLEFEEKMKAEEQQKKLIEQASQIINEVGECFSFAYLNQLLPRKLFVFEEDTIASVDAKKYLDFKDKLSFLDKEALIELLIVFNALLDKSTQLKK